MSRSNIVTCILAVAAMMLVTAGTSWAQDAAEPKKEEAATPKKEEAAKAKKADAAPARVNSVNANPMGVAFGSYSVNYERLFGGYNGLLVEATYSSMGSGDDQSTGYGGIIGYRFHWGGKQNSGFLGLNFGYQTGSGTAVVNVNGVGEKFEMDISQVSVVPNIGKRWAWDYGLNITLRFGVGYGDWKITSNAKGDNAKKAVELLDELLNLLPVALDGELSVGWTF